MVNDGHAWKDAFERLRLIGIDDEAFVDAGLNTDRNRARATAASLYVRYIITSNELTAYHDIIIQPQIRILIIKMIRCIYGRILELKQILVEEDFSIYTPVIEELINARLTHDQFELKIPRYFRDERQTFLEHMNNRIDEINARIALENNNPSEIQDELSEVEEHWSSAGQLISQKSSESLFDMATYLYNEQKIIPQILLGITEEDILRELSIKFIQKHIRAMKDRIIINELLADKRNRENILSGKYIEPSKEKVREAVVKIQRYWRFYRIRRQNRVRKERLNILVGMHNSSKTLNFNDNHDVENKIRLRQASADIELRKVVSKLQNKADNENRMEIIESIEDELREYIWMYYKTCKHLPSWPDSKPVMFSDDNILGLPPINLTEAILKSLNIPNIRYNSAMKQRVPLGGSAIFHTGRWMTIEMAEILATLIVEYERKPAKERNQLIKQLANENKILKEERVQIEKDIINEREKNRVLGFIPEPSVLTEMFKEILDEFDSDWTINRLNERPREDLINNEIFLKAQIELRNMVDNTTIKEDLNTLKIAYAQDLGNKYKAPKEKLTKSAKPRSKKNHFPNPEEIFEELVKNNMIKKSVTSKFNEFKGDVFYSGNALRGDPFYLDPPYGLGDIRQIIKELCVIGLTFAELRKLLKQVKFSASLLIAGPNKSGKTLLTNAICTETGSLKIELTLRNVSENYPNVKQINRLVKNIVKFAITYQPVLIEVDLADVPFYKKIPKELKLYKPKLMEKTLLKLLKSFKRTERVIIIGKATSPWLTSKTKLTKVFKTIVFTVPDYNTVFIFLNDLLMSYPAVDREFPVTPLATMLAGYPRHEVAAMVAEVMTQERVLELRIKPLNPFEFIPVMMKYQKKGPTLCDRYYNWYNKYVPLGVLKGQKMTEQSDARKKKKPSKK